METNLGRLTRTGAHLMCSGFELVDPYWMFDESVMPLDAPEYIATGSTMRIEYNGEVSAHVTFRIRSFS